MIRGKKKSGRVMSKPHPSCMRRAMASSLEVKAVVRGYHQYKVVWDAQVGCNTMLSSSLSSHSLLFRGVLSLLAPLLLLFESITERTSELEDAIDVDGQLLAISLPLGVLKWARLVASGRGTKSELIICGKIFRGSLLNHKNH